MPKPVGRSCSLIFGATLEGPWKKLLLSELCTSVGMKEKAARCPHALSALFCLHKLASTSLFCLFPRAWHWEKHVIISSAGSGPVPLKSWLHVWPFGRIKTVLPSCLLSRWRYLCLVHRYEQTIEKRAENQT